MADVNSSSQTSFANLDWNHYNQHRPPYPPSLKDLIYKYHTRHSDARWDLLVDVGGGVGISSIPFIADFDTVQLLDPSALNHEKARIFLGDYVSSHGLSTKLAFSVAKAEYGRDHVQNASLAICATTAHFIDPDDLTRSMAEILRPGGTLAIYSYWLPAFPDNSPSLTVALNAAATTAMRLCIQPGKEGDGTQALFRKVAARLMAGQTILDSVPVPQELFENVNRIRINPAAEVAFETYRNDPPVPCEPLPSQVAKTDTTASYSSGQDSEAEGWSLAVDLKWLHGLIRSILPAHVQLSQDQQESLYGELDRVYATECGSGSVRALFAVGIILATRTSTAANRPE